MSKKPSKKKAEESPDFDASMAEIEALIEQIESGSIGLEEQLEAYERGAKLLRQCRSLLDAAEQRVEEIDLELSRVEETGSGADEEGTAG